MGILFFFLGFGTGVYLCSGLSKVSDRERDCTDEVTAAVKSAKAHRFFGCKYYQLELEYIYGDKQYCIKKGYFKNEKPSSLTIHVNPNKPEEAYITTMAEKCGIREIDKPST